MHFLVYLVKIFPLNFIFFDIVVEVEELLTLNSAAMHHGAKIHINAWKIHMTFMLTPYQIHKEHGEENVLVATNSKHFLYEYKI